MSKKDLRVLVIFAGPNGAGKTTFAEKFCQKFKLDFINPDSINAENEVNKGKIFLKIRALSFTKTTNQIRETLFISIT